jgi:23S rRNA (guanosine2251-2'-O)-methyltransferase
MSQTTLVLRNPHSVLAAILTRPRDVIQVTVPGALSDRDSKSPQDAPVGRDAWLKVVQAARSAGIPVTSGGGGGKPSPRSDRDAGKSQQGGRLGASSEALVKERVGISAEEVFRGASERVEGKGLWLALDCLTDPQNVGAIFRTASFFGVQGIVLTQERSAPLTGSVYDVAAGGVEHVPFVQATNLQRAFEVAKDAGLWILGTSEHAKQGLRSIERDRPWLLVLGNEEKGMRRLTEESCDVVCQVAPRGDVTSLNVSVAAGVLISKLSGAV